MSMTKTLKLVLASTLFLISPTLAAAADRFTMKKTQAMIHELDLRDQDQIRVVLAELPAPKCRQLLQDGMRRPGVEGKYYLQMSLDGEITVWFGGGRIAEKTTWPQTYTGGSWTLDKNKRDDDGIARLERRLVDHADSSDSKIVESDTGAATSAVTLLAQIADPIAMERAQKAIDDLDLRDSDQRQIKLASLPAATFRQLLSDGMSRPGTDGKYFLRMTRGGSVDAWRSNGVSPFGNVYVDGQYVPFLDKQRKKEDCIARLERAIADSRTITSIEVVDPGESATQIHEIAPPQVGVRVESLPENPLGAFAKLVDRRVRVVYETSDDQRSTIVGSVKEIRRTGQLVNSVELQLNDKTTFSLTHLAGTLQLSSVVDFSGRSGHVLAIHVIESCPPATTRFVVEKLLFKADPSRWTIRYGSPTAVEQRSRLSRLLEIEPPHEYHDTTDYRVEVLDSPDRPFPLRTASTTSYVIRVAVYVPEHLDVLRRHTEAGVKNAKYNPKGADGREWTGAFLLNQDGLVVGGDIYHQTPRRDVRVESAVPRVAKPIPVDRKSPANPEHPRFRLAQQLLSRGQVPQAINEYSAAIAEGVNPRIAIRQRAICYEAIRDLSHAISDYGELLKIEPRDVESLVSRALCRMDMAQYKDAIDDLDLADNIAPNRPTILMARGLCQQRLNRTMNEVPDLTRASRLNPYSHLVVLNRSVIRDAFVRTNESFAFVQEYTGSNDPETVQSRWNRYQFNSLMSELYGTYDESGRRVFFSADSMNGLNFMRHSYLDEIQALKLRQRLPGQSEQPLLARSDQNAFQGTWLVTSVNLDGVRTSSESSPHVNVIWNGERMQLLVGGQVTMTLRSNVRREVQVVGQRGEQLRWWGEIDCVLVDARVPVQLKGWYLYQPPTRESDMEILAIKLSSAASVPRDQSRLARYESSDRWKLDLMMVRNDRVRRMDTTLAPSFAAAKNERLRGDLGKLQGRWLLAEVDGKPIPEPVPYTFEDDRIVKHMRMEGFGPDQTSTVDFEWDLELNETSEPKIMDWIYPRAGQRRLACYGFVNGNLIMAAAQFGEHARPMKINSDSANEVELLVFKRPPAGNGDLSR